MFAPITWAQIDYQRHRADRLMDTDWTRTWARRGTGGPWCSECEQGADYG